MSRRFKIRGCFGGNQCDCVRAHDTEGIDHCDGQHFVNPDPAFTENAVHQGQWEAEGGWEGMVGETNPITTDAVDEVIVTFGECEEQWHN